MHLKGCCPVRIIFHGHYDLRCFYGFFLIYQNGIFLRKRQKDMILLHSCVYFSERNKMWIPSSAFVLETFNHRVKGNLNQHIIKQSSTWFFKRSSVNIQPTESFDKNASSVFLSFSSLPRCSLAVFADICLKLCLLKGSFTDVFITLVVEAINLAWQQMTKRHLYAERYLSHIPYIYYFCFYLILFFLLTQLFASSTEAYILNQV